MEVCVYHALDSINEMNRKMPEVTLRDMFAIAALKGIVSANQMPRPEYHAELAYEYADAMLKARKTNKRT